VLAILYITTTLLSGHTAERRFGAAWRGFSDSGCAVLLRLGAPCGLRRLCGVEPRSDRRFVGGAESLAPILPPWDEEEIRRWEADPVWQATRVAPGAQFASAAGVAEWPVSRLTSWSERAGRRTFVRDLVPDDFDAYVRILFPFFGDERLEGKPVLYLLNTWHETALRNGREPHRLMDVVGVGLTTETTSTAGHTPSRLWRQLRSGRCCQSFRPALHRLGPGFCSGRAITAGRLRSLKTLSSRWTKAPRRDTAPSMGRSGHGKTSGVTLGGGGPRIGLGAGRPLSTWT